jgi:hypothetical protein
VSSLCDVVISACGLNLQKHAFDERCKYIAAQRVLLQVGFTRLSKKYAEVDQLLMI